MTWTYSNALTANKDKVRLLIADTDTADQQLADEEINWVITQEPNVYAAASKCCSLLAAKYSRQADTEVGDLSVKKSQRATAYRALAKDLKAQAVIDAPIFAPSLSISDKQSYEDDTDIPASKFFRDMQEYPGQDKEEPRSEERVL